MAFDINEFFKSIDIILTQRLSDLSYDKTVIATIVDDSDKERSHYVVSDGTIKFDAYSNDTSFKNDDQVCVTILNGDWSQKKFIIGKYSDKDASSSAINYIPPLGTVMQSNQSTLSKMQNWILQANGNVKKREIWSTKITPDSDYYALQTNGIYNVITLQGDFQTNLGQIKSGNYGLLLELYISPEADSNKRIKKFVTFDSSEMIGNPYSFIIDSRQSKSIAIATTEGIITEIILSVYQGQTYDVEEGKFIVEDNPFIGYDDKQITQSPINFKNIVIGFGSDLTLIENNTLQIYTPDIYTYHYGAGQGDDTNHKKLGLIWYNKTENNEYLGFSDGIVTVTNNKIDIYDEIDYLSENYGDNRLLAQKGKTGIPTDQLSLTLAANIEDSKILMQVAYKKLTTDLSVVLQSLNRQIGGTSIFTQVEKLISNYKENGITKKAKLVDYQNRAIESTNNLIELYEKVLLYGYNIQNGITLTDEDKWQLSWSNTNHYSSFISAMQNALNEVKTIINDFNTLTQVGEILSGYRNVYNSYSFKIAKVIKDIESILSQIIYKTYYNGITKTDEQWLSGYQLKVKSDFNVYLDRDLSQYQNKYCIYWYKYNPRSPLEYIPILSSDEWDELEEKQHTSYEQYVVSCEINNKEYRFGRFLGSDWQRIIPKDDNGVVLYNVGLPTTIGKVIDGAIHLPTSPESQQYLYTTMDPELPEERIQAVLFYNHEMVSSNVLVFTNTEADKIPNKFAVDANDSLLISHGAHSQDHYQSYGQTNELINIADESRTRELRVAYDGVSLGDEALAGAGIFWYVPTNSTMLTYDKEYLVDSLQFNTDAGPLQLTLTGSANATQYTFSEDIPEQSQLVGARIGTRIIESQDLINKKIVLNKTLSSSAVNKRLYDISGASIKTQYSKEGYVYFYKQIKYTIQESDATDSNGDIIYNPDGTIAKNIVTVLDEVDRHFAYKIKPYYEPSAQNNTILTEAHIQSIDNEIKIISGEVTFTFSTFGTNGTKYTLVMTPASRQTAVLPAAALNLNLSLRNAENELITINDSAVGSLADEPNTINAYQLRVNWHAKSANSGTIMINDIADSEVKNLEIANGRDSNQYVGILAAKVSYLTTGKTASQPRVITLNTLYPVAFSANEDYYISGPTSIVYDNLGNISRLSEEPFVLYKRYNRNASNDIIPNSADTRVINQKWSIIYYDNNGVQVAPTDAVMDYMPSLNSDNTLMPAPMYFAYDNSKFYVPVVQCTVNGSIAWTQPIVITQNRYASSTLNDWDGQFVIDEANGTILSTMVGAGRKNENNSFEGVLMGDIEAGANFDTNNANGIGLYGFHDGAQSFYFGVNGKAFLGKSGRGRIYFDGNKGAIMSASYYANELGDDANPIGMLLDVDDGFIDMRGASDGTYDENGNVKTYKADGYSTHIRLNSAPKHDKDPYFLITSPNSKNNVNYVDKALINISRTEHYLQSEDYEAGLDELQSDGTPNAPGTGMKIDLANSLIDSYNLKVVSKNIYLDSTKDASTHLVVKDNDGNNLLFVGSGNYYLKSSNFTSRGTDSQGNGCKFDLNAGSITAHNFSIVAGNENDGMFAANSKPEENGVEGRQYYFYAGIDNKNKQSYISIDDEGAVNVRAQSFHLNAPGKFTYLDNTIKEGNIIINSGDNRFPIRIESLDRETDEIDPYNKPNKIPKTYCRIGWDGVIYAKGGKFSGTVEGSDIIGATGYFAKLYCGGNGTQDDEDYIFKATDSTVTITNATITGENTENKNSYQLDSDGSATFTNLTVKENVLFTKSCQAKIEGALGINIAPVLCNLTKKNFDISVEGNGLFKGRLYFGSDQTEYLYAGDVYSDGEDGIIVGGNNIALYSKAIWIGDSRSSGTATSTYIRGNVTISPDNAYVIADKDYSLLIKGQSKIAGELYYDANIHTAVKDDKGNPTDTYLDGQNADFSVDAPGWFSGNIGLKFRNGILVGVEGKATEDDAVQLNGLPAPDAKDAGKVALSVENKGDGVAGLVWNTIPSLLKTGLNALGNDSNHYIRQTNSGVFWSSICFPTSFSATAGYVWATTVASDTQAQKTGSGSWKSIGSLLYTNIADSGKFLKASSTLGTVVWESIYAPTSRGEKNQVWTSGGTSNPTWTSIGSLLNTSANNNKKFLMAGSTAGTISWETLGALAFANDIKKKFNMTLSGTVPATKHDFYVESGTASYTEQGESVGIYVEGPSIYPTVIGTPHSPEYVTDYTGYVIKTSQTLYESGGNDVRYHVDTPNKTYYYKAGTRKSYKTYTKAGTLNVSITKSQDITLEPSTTATSSIDIAASSGTVTIS